jgi:hypothetical protein
MRIFRQQFFMVFLRVRLFASLFTHFIELLDRLVVFAFLLRCYATHSGTVLVGENVWTHCVQNSDWCTNLQRLTDEAA